jgi:hypothetical protein
VSSTGVLTLLTAQAAAVGTLAKLVEHPDTRKRVVRDIVAGQYNLNPVDPWRLKAPGLNP